MWLFFYFHFKRNLINTKQNQKWKISHTVLERRTLRFSLFKNRKLRAKLWLVMKENRGHFWYRLFCPKEFF